ncbi:uncharacterized protein BDCG_04166 [Blastomyces dermatitidis ER-3]|uniref:Uncharacterized protein n=1 Tax=Ajellomyces dermatitidis (strain ER-3 / ATCC MYA-2586) TaxID=559297 RepID=A0ABP2EXZ5_AJEDR|nr:uncharacterized protein BDCG_04166 [Blastomyces dermatitidis ER-3]EEQ89046.2 hypothetical protein BDCG_04166 [Blastomyces dermatitidis ER-3]
MFTSLPWAEELVFLTAGAPQLWQPVGRTEGYRGQAAPRDHASPIPEIALVLATLFRSAIKRRTAKERQNSGLAPVTGWAQIFEPDFQKGLYRNHMLEPGNHWGIRTKDRYVNAKKAEKSVKRQQHGNSAGRPQVTCANRSNMTTD